MKVIAELYNQIEAGKQPLTHINYDDSFLQSFIQLADYNDNHTVLEFIKSKITSNTDKIKFNYNVTKNTGMKFDSIAKIKKNNLQNLSYYVGTSSVSNNEYYESARSFVRSVKA